MIPLYSTEQNRSVDGYAINKLKMPGIILMENASREIFRSISDYFNFRSIGFVCGKGNNGGDGFASARHFANAGYIVKVVYLGNENQLSDDAAVNFQILKKLSQTNKNISLRKFQNIKSLSIINNCDVLCDAMLGSGAKGALREPYLSIVKYLNKLKVKKAAIDIPTGLDADKGYSEEAFKADLTITLGNYKKGLFFGSGNVYAGNVEKGDIGVPENYFENLHASEFLIEPEDALNGLPSKSVKLNKYSAGKVLTIAGSESYPGAAVLTAKAVMKIGAGASILAFPKSCRSLIQKKLGETVVKAYHDSNGYFDEISLKEISGNIDWAKVIAIGPGIGREDGTQKAVLKLLKQRKNKRIVIDADAVFALGNKNFKKLNLKNCVLTPHYGEFSNLIGIEIAELERDILKYGRQFVKETGAYLVLKDAPTIIFTPGGDALINSAGNPALAKFGTGDVLTGFIAGMLAQQEDFEKAVVTAVYLHSLTADLIVKRTTEFTLLANDLINYLSNAINFLRKSIV